MLCVNCRVSRQLQCRGGEGASAGAAETVFGGCELAAVT